jgi:CheY-like chemotaxis protein
MEHAEALDDDLLEALSNLYNPDYEPTELIAAVTGCDLLAGPTPVQAALLRAIEALKPESPSPYDSHLRRVYEVIHSRFVLKLTQEKTAELLDISVRHLNRVQREAIHTLAQRLWWQHATGSPPDMQEPPLQGTDWQTQSQRELASLRASAPDVVSDVAQVIENVLALRASLSTAEGLSVRAGFIQPGLQAAIHPSILQQVLITAAGRLVRLHAGEPVTIFADLEDGKIKITLMGALPAAGVPDADGFVRDLVIPEGVSVDVSYERGHVFVRIRVVAVGGKVTVMVVDDNSDMVHFYRRATTGTRYEIIHMADGQALLDALQNTLPAVIVLDVMLPNIDGWTLLMRLHENPRTRSIPVIVCTVIREEELALSLGATLYLAKPVRPRQFLQALDQALSQPPAGASTEPPSTEAAY